jgi:hypothetical protein
MDVRPTVSASSSTLLQGPQAETVSRISAAVIGPNISRPVRARARHEDLLWSPIGRPIRAITHILIGPRP